jgi:hypothetical protein
VLASGGRLNGQRSLPRRSRRRRREDADAAAAFGDEQAAVWRERKIGRRFQIVDDAIDAQGQARAGNSDAFGGRRLRDERDADRRGAGALENTAVVDERRELQRVRSSRQLK